VKVQRPSARSRAPSGARSAQQLLLGLMIWSGLTGNCEWLSEADSRNTTQNLPRPEGDEFGIRSAFIPKQGYILVGADYEQLEMRLMAHESEDANMIDVIRRGWDIHAGSATLMYDRDYDAVIAASKRKKEVAKLKEKNLPYTSLTELELAMIFERQAAKTIGFALNYGEGDEKLAKALGISISRAKALKEEYFKPYPGVRDFINGVHYFIHDYGFVETILGRPRRFHEMTGIIPKLKRMSRWHLPGADKANLARCERQGPNAVIQGSAADLAKMAMLNCEHSPELRDLGVEMLLQVHDELLFEVPEETVDEAIPIIRDLMEHPLPDELLVPLGVDIGRGYSWSTAKA